MSKSAVKDEKTLTEALRMISSYHNRHGYPPTVREIGESLSFASPSSAMAVVKILASRGMITMRNKMPRTIMMTEAGKLRIEQK